MRTDIMSFVLSSENRKKVAKMVFSYPKRQWSCSSLEELTGIPHSTVFRTLNGLRDLGILKSVKINRKDVLYEFVKDFPLAKELEKMLSIEEAAVRKAAKDFIKKIKSKRISSAILYGSSVSGGLNPESDIDILIVLCKHDKDLEREILDTSAKASLKMNKTISVTIMDLEELNKEKDSQFIKSVMSNMEVLYGKKPF